MNTLLRKAAALAAFPSVVVVSLTLAAPRSHAQTKADSPADRSLHGGAAAGDSSSRSTSAADGEIPAAVAKELEAMKERIEQLETELKAKKAQEQAGSSASLVPAEFKIQRAPEPAAPTTVAATSAAQTAPPEKPKPAEPFAYADWTWLNGTPRNKDAVWDSKFFTPEIRFDTHFVESFNHPRDDSMGGSSEIFRSNEIQVEQISFGGDFHWQNVRGRVLTMNGMFGVTTPRNDASPGRGPMGPSRRVPLRIGSLRRVPLRREPRAQHRRGNLRLLYRPVQLLQLRQLGLPAVLCVLQHAMVFQWHTHTVVSHR